MLKRLNGTRSSTECLPRRVRAQHILLRVWLESIIKRGQSVILNRFHIFFQN